MSLEKAIQENTEVMRLLIAALTKGVVMPPAAPSEAANKPEKATEELSYSSIQKPFLKLVNKDRDAAVTLLDTLGIKKLDGVKPEEYPAVLKMIEEKLNG